MSNIRTSLAIPTEPWEAAKAKFLEDLSPEEKLLFENATLQNVFYGASTAQKKHAQSSSWLLQERLSSIVDAIDDYAKALDVFSNAYSLVCCPLWGGLRVVLHIAGEAGKLQKNIVDMLARIGDTLPRFGIYQVLFNNHERLAIALSSVYLDVLRFCVATKDFFTRARRSMIPLSIIVMAAWKTQRQLFDDTMVDFRSHSKRVEKEARLAHMIESAKSREIQLANRALQIRNQKIQKRHQMLASLPTVDYVAKHLRALNRRHPGTNLWIHKVSDYISWKSKSGSSGLCCYGIPGSGKSVLCASLIDHLQEELQNGVPQTHSAKQASIVCYYYCDYSDKNSLGLVAILASIVKQILEALPLDCFEDGFECPLTEHNSVGGIQKVVQYLQTLLQRFEAVYLLFDGIDQLSSDVQSFVLDMFQRLLQDRSSKSKMFVTSRSEEYLVKTTLRQFGCIYLSDASIQSDIETFIRARIDVLSVSHNTLLQNQALREDVIEALCVGAQDMFLWVDFQLHEVAGALTETALRLAIHDLPTNLADTYCRIFNKIYRAAHSTSNRPIALQVLLWLRGARRPLKIDELEEAVGLDYNDSCLPTERIARNAGQRLISLCCNLVIHDKEDNTVLFAHHTVQQFLDSLGSVTTDGGMSHPWSYLVRQEDAAQHVAKICIAYLSFTDFETQIVKTVKQLDIDKEQIERYVWGDIPMAQSVLTFLKWSKLERNDGRRPIRLHMPVTPRPADTLAKRYLMLDYIVAHWAFHIEALRADDSVFQESAAGLVCHKILSFNFRPWHDPEHSLWTKQSIVAYIKASSKKKDHDYEADVENMMRGTSSNDLLLYSWCMKHGVRFPLKFLHVAALKPYMRLMSDMDQPQSKRQLLPFWNTQSPEFTKSVLYEQFLGVVLRTTVTGSTFWTGTLLLQLRDNYPKTMSLAIREYLTWSDTAKPLLEDMVCEGASLAMQTRPSDSRQISDTEDLVDHLNLADLGWLNCYKLLAAVAPMKDVHENLVVKLLGSPSLYAWTTTEQYQSLLFALHEVQEILSWGIYYSDMSRSMKEAVFPILFLQGQPSVLSKILSAATPYAGPYEFCFPTVDWKIFEFGSKPLYDRFRSLDGKHLVQEATKITILATNFKLLRKLHHCPPTLVTEGLAACENTFDAEQFERDDTHCLEWAIEERSYELVNMLSPHYAKMMHDISYRKLKYGIVSAALAIERLIPEPHLPDTERRIQGVLIASAILALFPQSELEEVARHIQEELQGEWNPDWDPHKRLVAFFVQVFKDTKPQEFDRQFKESVLKGSVEGGKNKAWLRMLQHGFPVLQDKYSE